MPISHSEMVVRMLVAMLLGGLIGFERGRSDHPAGLRTHALVALASATFMLVSSQFVFFQHYVEGGLVRVDASRIASGVVMGMGFVGAGSILRTGLNVHGITTAACLWLVSAIGLASGSGMFFEAAAATGVSLFVLVGLNAFELRWKQKVKRKTVIDLDENQLTRTDLIAQVNTGKSLVTGINYDCDVQTRKTCLELEVILESEQEIEDLLDRLGAIPGVRRVRVQSPSEPS